MTPARWTLILLAALAIGSGLLHAVHDPAGAPPASPPAVAALPLRLPDAASAAAAAPQPVAVAAAPGLTTHTPAPPRVGSEGYGPHIDRALAGSDAQAAWEAVQWLRSCAATEARRQSFETARNQGVAQDMLTQLMVEADAEARRCQTVTPYHRAQLPELAARALRAGVADAAAAYASSAFPDELTPAQRQQVADAMRRDAAAGHAQSLLGALRANEAWGIGDAEKLVYAAAYDNLPDPPETPGILKSLMAQGSVRLKTPPTQEQLAAARQAAQPILDRARAGRQP